MGSDDLRARCSARGETADATTCDTAPSSELETIDWKRGRCDVGCAGCGCNGVGGDCGGDCGDCRLAVLVRRCSLAGLLTSPRRKRIRIGCTSTFCSRGGWWGVSRR